MVGRREERRTFGRPKRRWKDNIVIDLQEFGRRGIDWSALVKDIDSWRTLVNTALK
jgi:hypothetical protein